MPEKYKDEIEEILRRAEEVAPAVPSREDEKTSRHPPQVKQPSNRPHQPSPGQASQWRWPSLSPGKFAVAGLVLLLVGALIWTLLIWLGLGLLALAFLLSFAKPHSISYEKRWRGRPVEERPSLLERFKRWLKV